MNPRNFRHGVNEFFALMGSAIAVSAASRNHGPVRDSDLHRLGIDPDQFRSIRRR